MAIIHKVKIVLHNFECGKCETGVVQILEVKKGRNLRTTVSGCLDCGHSYGINQTLQLKPYTRNDLVWG